MQRRWTFSVRTHLNANHRQAAFLPVHMFKRLSMIAPQGRGTSHGQGPRWRMVSCKISCMYSPIHLDNSISTPTPSVTFTSSPTPSATEIFLLVYPATVSPPRSKPLHCPRSNIRLQLEPYQDQQQQLELHLPKHQKVSVPSTTRSKTRLSKQTTTSNEATCSPSRDCHLSGARFVVAFLSSRPRTLLRRNSASFCRARKSRISPYGVPNGNDCGLLESLPGSLTSL